MIYTIWLQCHKKPVQLIGWTYCEQTAQAFARGRGEYSSLAIINVDEPQDDHGNGELYVTYQTGGQVVERGGGRQYALEGLKIKLEGDELKYKQALEKLGERDRIILGLPAWAT